MYYGHGMRLTPEEARIVERYKAEWRAYEKRYRRQPPLRLGIPFCAEMAYEEMYGTCKRDNTVYSGPNAGLVWDEGDGTYKDPNAGYNH